MTALAGLAVLVSPAPAAVASTGNDDIGSATAVGSLPFTVTEDTSGATSDPGDPTWCGNNGSVWFAYTPATTAKVKVSTAGSNYDTVLSAWTGSPGALNLFACNDNAGDTLQSQLVLPLAGGTTYYFMVTLCCGTGRTGGGTLNMTLDPVPAPVNDNFADATPITAIPATQTVDLTAATTESGEPLTVCNTDVQNTAWYSFTATATQSVTARLDQFEASLAVYTGASLGALSQVSCRSFDFQSQVFRAEAGTTYYLQAGVPCCAPAGPVTLHLDVAANPSVGVISFPSDPSTYDSVSFDPFFQDPAGGTIATQTWDLGDGTTSSDCCPVHRYASEGDYLVRVTVTTVDGRTASGTTTVQVRTHDVAIVDIAVPNTAHQGQTIAVTVRLQNTWHPETVEMDLFTGDFNAVGTLTQFVPVRPPGGTTTRFSFSYTVTPNDVAIGKVTFRASANIQNQRDAQPADNLLLSAPVKIN
jgi:hypothetical protein